MNKKLQDLAWSILPKEFKEEVKNYYEHTDSCSREEDVLESIFGEHNLLTSDAEGEVELLHVTRQKVMGLYANAKKIHDLYTSATCINTKESQQIDICKGVMSILDTLFGSKCLPDGNKECSNPSVVNCKHKHGDGTCSLSGMCCYKSPKPAEPEEKDDCKKFTKRLDDTLEGDIKEPFKEWRDKNSSNVEKLEKNGEVEPKPAEPKFKPGDKVLKKDHNYENEGCPYDIFLGYIGHDKGGYLCAVEAHGWIMHESDLEPYTEPNTKPFKIGDKVRYKEVYTIEEIEKDGIALVDSDFLVDPEDLELYEESKEDKAEEIAEKAIKPVEKYFDSILKDSFAKERRLNIAAMVMQGIMANPSPQMVEMDVHRVADLAILMADTLIVECEKGGRK